MTDGFFNFGWLFSYCFGKPVEEPGWNDRPFMPQRAGGTTEIRGAFAGDYGIYGVYSYYK
jgi:hypothetical protein